MRRADDSEQKDYSVASFAYGASRIRWRGTSKELPTHLTRMALFKVNTGCRDQEVCGLRWEWEVQVPELDNTRVFIIPSAKVKNGDERLVY